MEDQSIADFFVSELVSALTKANVTPDQVKFATEQAVEKTFYPYPAPYDWVRLCREYGDSRLPNADAVMQELNEYCANRYNYPDATKYPWSHPVMYWIVIDLRGSMLEQNLSFPALKKMAFGKLKDWTKRLDEGEQIPEPKMQLENKRAKKTDCPSKRWETGSSMMTGIAMVQAMRQKIKANKEVLGGES